MRVLTLTEFLHSEHYDQIIDEFTSELNRQAYDEIYPDFVSDNNLKEIDYIHFMHKNEFDSSMQFLSAFCTYRKFRDKIIRTIKEVRIYKHETEQDFYMALHEYDNAIDPNPVLFN